MNNIKLHSMINGVVIGAVLGIVVSVIYFKAYTAQPRTAVLKNETSVPKISTQPVAPSLQNSVAGAGFNLLEFCSAETCLFKRSLDLRPLGLVTLEGYYTTQTLKGWDSEPNRCEAFVVTKGPVVWLKYAQALIKDSSAVTSGSDGHPIINIATTQLSSGVKRKIKDSRQAQPIEISAVSTGPHERGENPCFPLVAILNVK